MKTLALLCFTLLSSPAYAGALVETAELTDLALDPFIVDHHGNFDRASVTVDHVNQKLIFDMDLFHFVFPLGSQETDACGAVVFTGETIKPREEMKLTVVDHRASSCVFTHATEVTLATKDVILLPPRSTPQEILGRSVMRGGALVP